MPLILALVLAIPLGLDLYMPVPEDNPLTMEKIQLGRRLFFDRRLSRSGSVSCATCHRLNRAFSDDRPLAVGVFGRVGRRNAPALINRGYGLSFFRDGRVATLEEQVLKPIEDPKEMDLPVAEAARRAGISAENLSRALASYVRTILSGNSPYDRFINGDRRALTAEQQRGLQIFRGRGNCTACHVGPNLSDEQFHNTGVAFQHGAFQDDGRFAVTRRAVDRGAFRTPTLREIARTAPYMHNGTVATLEEVVEFYDRGGRANPHLDPEIRPLSMTAGDKQALVGFLKTLSGTMYEGRHPRAAAAPRASAPTLDVLWPISGIIRNMRLRV
jgi:cytochrome c peroxidase